MILVPVKNFVNAKQRLSAVLDPEARQDLAQAMCTDVLETLAAWPRRPEVMVVTGDACASGLARRLGFAVLPDPVDPGETGAIAMATEVCRASGAQFTMVIPADIPLVESAELDRIMECAPPAGTVLVPDADGRGTNAALRVPADLFPLHFGNDSFLPHRAAAEATGLPCIVLELPGIARDVDRPEDLRALASAPGERQAQRLVRGWNVARWDIRAADLDEQVCRG